MVFLHQCFESNHVISLDHLLAHEQHWEEVVEWRTNFNNVDNNKQPLLFLVEIWVWSKFVRIFIFLFDFLFFVGVFDWVVLKDSADEDADGNNDVHDPETIDGSPSGFNLLLV